MKKQAFFICLLTPYLLSAQNDNSLNVKINAIHNRIVSIDTHVDTPMKFLKNSSIDIGKRGNTLVDLVKMNEGGLDAAYFAIFIEQKGRNNAEYILAQKNVIDQHKAIRQQIEKNADKVALVTTPIEIWQLKREGKKAILMGIENGYGIGKDLSLLSKYKNMGVSYITLSHTKNNDICDSSTDKVEHNGLSKFGEQMIAEMNRLGIIIDISHTSDKTFYDVIRLSKAPVIASHSCARAITNNPRNLNDNMLRLLANNGGVIQLCILSRFLRTPSSQGKATVKDVVDHIDHIVKVAGISHVGIGSDFDGGGGIADCKDASEMKNITAELLRRKYTEQDIEKIWGGNFFRVMNNVQQLAK